MVDDRIPAAAFGLVFAALVFGSLFLVKSYWGTVDAVFLVIGLVFGLGLLPAMATPFVPSPPRKGGVLQQFVKIYMTISSMILGASVFYLKGSGEYVRKRIDIDGDTVTFVADGTRETWEGAKQRLISFGRRPLGLAWSDEHPLYQDIIMERDIETDGGEPATLVNIDQLHRMLRGVNLLQAIDAAVKDAKDEYGGGDDGLSQRVLIVSIFVLFVTGFGLVIWAMS